MLYVTPQSKGNSPKTRDQNLLIPPVPRAQLPPGLFQSVPWAMSSCQGAQEWQHRSRDLLSTPWRPSSDVVKCWALAPPQKCLKTRTKVATKNSGYNFPHGFLTWDRAWLHLLTPSHTQAASGSQALLWLALQGLQGNLHLPSAA